MGIWTDEEDEKVWDILSPGRGFLIGACPSIFGMIMKQKFHPRGPPSVYLGDQSIPAVVGAESEALD